MIRPWSCRWETTRRGFFAAREFMAAHGAAEAFVVVTPEYNHGYPAALKSLIDSVGAEWQAKPVAFVSYGGASGGLRAVEQLRLVFAELHAVTIRDSVSFASAWEQFDETGKLRHPERADRSMATLLNRLHWWAVALRNARRRRALCDRHIIAAAMNAYIESLRILQDSFVVGVAGG